jgi:hypothetical protein
MLERSNLAFANFGEAQDALSTVWPALIELGQERRLRGERANNEYFLSPWGDGIMFGDFKVFEFRDIELAAPRLIALSDFRRPADTYEIRHLWDFYAQKSKRLLAIMRTFIGPSEMRPHQVRLKKVLDEFANANAGVLSYLKLKPRLGLDIANYDPAPPYDRYPDAFARSLGIVPPTAHQIASTVTRLDEITKSADWLHEAEFSRQNRAIDSETALDREQKRVPKSGSGGVV